MTSTACGFCEKDEVPDPRQLVIVRSRVGFHYATKPCPHCNGTGLAPQGERDE